MSPCTTPLCLGNVTICTTQACSHGRLQGFQTKSDLAGIPSLQYVDDSTFFMEGSMEAVKNLSLILNLFANVPGLQINRGKSAVVYFGLSSEEEVQCSQALGTENMQLSIR